jgi:hypothetical protein
MMMKGRNGDASLDETDDDLWSKSAKNKRALLGPSGHSK